MSVDHCPPSKRKIPAPSPALEREADIRISGAHAGRDPDAPAYSEHALERKYFRHGEIVSLHITTGAVLIIDEDEVSSAWMAVNRAHQMGLITSEQFRLICYRWVAKTNIEIAKIEGVERHSIGRKLREAHDALRQAKTLYPEIMEPAYHKTPDGLAWEIAELFRLPEELVIDILNLEPDAGLPSCWPLESLKRAA